MQDSYVFHKIILNQSFGKGLIEIRAVMPSTYNIRVHTFVIYIINNESERTFWI